MSTKMDENIENSGEESDNDSILDLDLNPDGVIRPFMFVCNIAHLQEKKKFLLTKKLRKRYKKKHLRAHVLEIANGALAATVKRCQQKTSVYAAKKWMY